MAIFRLFAEKDSSIYTEFDQSNTGLDEILEIGAYTDIGGNVQTVRSLIKFNNEDIKDILNNQVNSYPYTSSLKLFIGEATELPVNYNIEVYPISEDWDQGIGKYGDVPVNKTGVSWVYRRANATSAWKTSLFDTNTTASFQVGDEGGGTWFTGSLGVSLQFSQSFNVKSNQDLNINVTPAVNLFYSESINNNGFVLKLNESIEKTPSGSVRLKYFSSDTNTIYPPFLEFKWDDSSYETGSLSILSSTENIISLKNNKGEYFDEGKIRFRITSRPKYPARTFNTSSIYLTNYALPENSYWGIKDEFSNEMVVDFDTKNTKISCDSSGPFFDLYLDSFEPERYYRVLYRTTIDGSTAIIDNKDIFKVIHNE